MTLQIFKFLKGLISHLRSSNLSKHQRNILNQKFLLLIFWEEIAKGISYLI